MCGIMASVGLDVPTAHRERSLGLLARRGPDDSGTWSDDRRGVWLGHRRLAINDLTSAGHQPMPNESRTTWLTSNSEIYNAPALRRRLESLGHEFRSASDNEVILHGYEQWGENVVDHLEGMYAFAIWDGATGTLFAARDRMGIKPLYYRCDQDFVALSSDSAALAALIGGRHAARPDPRALAYVLTLGYVPSPLSAWQGMRRLSAAHVLTWQAGRGERLRRYWEPPREVSAVTAATRDWEALFEEVVADHLLADVPACLLLSGGIDSTSLAVALRRIGRPLEALTVGFPGSTRDESFIAAAVARANDLPHRTLPWDAGRIDELLTEVTAAFDEPQGHSALATMQFLARATAHDYKVALAGDGGDEVFGGYRWYRHLGWTAAPIAAPVRLARAMLRGTRTGLARRAAGKAFGWASPMHRHARRLFSQFLPEEAEALLAPLGVTFKDDDMLEPLRRHLVPTLPFQRALQRVDLMTFCTDSILPKVDRASMAYGLEVRVPLLDRRIVEWGLSQPLSESVGDGKATLRRYVTPWVPAEVLRHPKVGFSLPDFGAFSWDDALERIRLGRPAREGWFASDWPKYLAHGAPNRRRRTWTLLAVTNWADSRLAGAVASAR